LAYEQLRPGDCVKITHRVKVGLKIWTTELAGTVLRIERRRQGLNVERNFDDKAYCDMVVLRKEGPAPEETAIALDEFTHIERLA
jgi:hypothetical protein